MANMREPSNLSHETAPINIIYKEYACVSEQEMVNTWATIENLRINDAE